MPGEVLLITRGFLIYETSDKIIIPSEEGPTDMNGCPTQNATGLALFFFRFNAVLNP